MFHQQLASTTARAIKLDHDGPPSPNIRKKDNQNKSSCTHVPTFGRRVFLWAIDMGPFDSGGVYSMVPSFVYGIQLVCIGVQIRGPYQGPIRKPLDLEPCCKSWAAGKEVGRNQARGDL